MCKKARKPINNCIFISFKNSIFFWNFRESRNFRRQMLNYQFQRWSKRKFLSFSGTRTLKRWHEIKQEALENTKSKCTSRHVPEKDIYELNNRIMRSGARRPSATTSSAALKSAPHVSSAQSWILIETNIVVCHPFFATFWTLQRFENKKSRKRLYFQKSKEEFLKWDSDRNGD